MMSQCWECGQKGHLRRNCPDIQCRQCRQWGHLTQNCGASTTSAKQKPRNKNRRKGKNPPSSNAHQLPLHWTLSKVTNGSCVDGIGRLGRRGLKCEVVNLSQDELKEIKHLVQDTWKTGLFGKCKDAMGLHHSYIKVINVERIENPGKFEKYSLRKQEMLQRLKSASYNEGVFRKLETIQCSTGPVMTTKAIGPQGVLRRNIYPRINEHYLFHGTKVENVDSITDNGFDMGLSLGRSLMGAGIYFAESPAKSDMYADPRERRTVGKKHMFLVRVLLGEHYVNKIRQKHVCRKAPCRRCFLKTKSDKCVCNQSDPFDSVVDDSREDFRSFVVYDSSQCYPEYLITYIRVNRKDDAYDDDDDDDGGNYYNETYREEEGSFDDEEEEADTAHYRFYGQQATLPTNAGIARHSQPPTTPSVGQQQWPVIPARGAPEMTSASSARRPATPVATSFSVVPSLSRNASNKPTPTPLASDASPNVSSSVATVASTASFLAASLSHGQRFQATAVKQPSTSSRPVVDTSVVARSRPNEPEDDACCHCCIDMPEDVPAIQPCPDGSVFLRVLDKAGIVLGVVIMLGALATSVAMVVYGGLHFKDCPGSSYLTIYLQVLGFCSAIMYILQSVVSFTECEVPRSFYICLPPIIIINVALLISGFVVVYPKKEAFSHMDSNATDYCDQRVFDIAFSTTTAQTVLFVLFPLCLFLMNGWHKRVLNVVAGMFVVVGVLLLALAGLAAVALPIAFVVMGAVHLHDCPGLGLLSPAMTGGGAALLLYVVTLLVCLCCQQKKRKCLRVAIVTFALLLIGCQVLGYIYLYPYKGDELGKQSSSSASYCETTLYSLAFFTTNYISVIYLLVPAFLAACT